MNADEVYVIGVGMTPFGRLIDEDIKTLTRRAVTQALEDAGISSKDLRAAFFANSTQGHMQGQQMIRGQVALRSMGIEGIPVINVENACASGSTALTLGVQYLRAGEGDVVLAVGAEKMWSPEREKMLSVFDSACDVSDAEQTRARLIALGQGLEVPPGSTSSKSYSVFMDVYAAFARAHMKRYGTTQKQLAAVASKNHLHSVDNPLAQYRESYTIEQVLHAPPITYPLTLPMCSPVSDGAAAAILCTKDGLKRMRASQSRAVRVLSSVIQSGTDRLENEVERHCTVLASKRAYELAGIGPKDVSVAEVHDATAMGEIIQTENLGFCNFGEGGELAERGVTSIGGQIPINPSGGLESKGHPIGATGLGQIYELVQQLRGEAGARQVQGAKIALSENGGGLYGIEEAVACVTILAR